jgi:hypothetical protein
LDLRARSSFVAHCGPRVLLCLQCNGLPRKCQALFGFAPELLGIAITMVA